MTSASSRTAPTAWRVVALLCATATASYVWRVNVSTAPTPVVAAWIGWGAALHIAAALAVEAAFLWLGVRPTGVRA